MRRIAASVVALTALVSTTGTARAATADQEQAEAAVLTEADVPTGFTGGPYTDTSRAPVLRACKGAIARADRMVESSPIARSAFQLSDTRAYALIENAVAVLASQQQAKRAMAAYAQETAAEACIQARMDDAFTETGIGTTVAVGSFDPSTDSTGSAKIIQGGDDFYGFAGSIRRMVGGAPQFFEYQVVLAREGRAVTQLVIVAQGSIPPAEARQMLQTVVTRMGDITRSKR